MIGVECESCAALCLSHLHEWKQLYRVMEGTVAADLDKAERENSPAFLFCSFLFPFLRKHTATDPVESVDMKNRDRKVLEKCKRRAGIWSDAGESGEY